MLRVIFVGVLATSLVLESANKQLRDVRYVENKACSAIGRKVYACIIILPVQCIKRRTLPIAIDVEYSVNKELLSVWTL